METPIIEREATFDEFVARGVTANRACVYPRGFNERRRRPSRGGNRSFGRKRGEPMAPSRSVPTISSARHDAVTATALTVVRRALVEGVPVTREVVEREASVNLGASPKDAMQQVDLVAQRLGVSSSA